MNYDAVIIGNGISGLCAGLALSRRGQRVCIIGRKGLQGAATPRAAGILDPFLEMSPGSPLFRFARQAFLEYPAWLKSLDKTPYASCGYKPVSMIYVAMNPAEKNELQRRLAWQKKCGIPVRWLAADEMIRMEPLVSRHSLGGLFYPFLPRIQPEKLMRVLSSAFRKKGGRFMNVLHPPGLKISAGKVAGVRVGQKEFFCGTVVYAAGAWAGCEKNPVLKLPVKPVRGQVLIVPQGKNKISSILHSLDGGYIVPWDAGTLLLGSTVEFSGFNPVVTAKGLRSIRRRVEKIVPSLQGVKALSSWAGLRPFPKDRLPVLGQGRVKGLYFAAGYYRSGILISGLAGELLADGILKGKMPALFKPFSVSRFDKQGPNER